MRLTISGQTIHCSNNLLCTQRSKIFSYDPPCDGNLATGIKSTNRKLKIENFHVINTDAVDNFESA